MSASVFTQGPPPTRNGQGETPAVTQLRPGPYPMGLMALLATVTMLFAAFTAALLMRRAGADWRPVALPSVAWLSTAAIVLSSGALELARRRVGAGAVQGVVPWLWIATGLGVLFLGGQILGWRELAARGVFLPSSPHAAFFYLLTAVHGAHVIGGLGALLWTTRRAERGAYVPDRQTGLDHTAIYWHFVGLIWIYLFALLSTL